MSRCTEPPGSSPSAPTRAARAAPRYRPARYCGHPSSSRDDAWSGPVPDAARRATTAAGSARSPARIRTSSRAPSSASAAAMPATGPPNGQFLAAEDRPLGAGPAVGAVPRDDDGVGPGPRGVDGAGQQRPAVEQQRELVGAHPRRSARRRGRWPRGCAPATPRRRGEDVDAGDAVKAGGAIRDARAVGKQRADVQHRGEALVALAEPVDQRVDGGYARDAERLGARGLRRPRKEPDLHVHILSCPGHPPMALMVRAG